MKVYVRERKDAEMDRWNSLSALLSTRLPHQVEEDVPKVSPVVIGLGTVGPRGAHHVSEDPSVDVEVLEVEGEGEGEGELSEKSTTRREGQGKWGQRGKRAVNVHARGGAMGRCWRKRYFKRRGRRRVRKSDFFLSGALWVWANVWL